MNFPEADVEVTQEMQRAGVWAMLVERKPTESWERHVAHIYKVMYAAAHADADPCNCASAYYCNRSGKPGCRHNPPQENA